MKYVITLPLYKRLISLQDEDLVDFIMDVLSK